MADKRAGFTLVELMIVIAIMGTMAALLAPGLGEFLADVRASSAAEDLVRLARHTRARAQETGLAHLLVFTSDSGVSGGLGNILVYEGLNNHCRQTPWPQTIGGTIANGHTPVESLDMQAYNPVAFGSAAHATDLNRQVITLSVAGSLGAPAAAVLCFEPGGLTSQGTGDGSSVGYSFVAQSTDVTFSVTRTVSGEQRGPVRQIVFPPGGSARLVF